MDDLVAVMRERFRNHFIVAIAVALGVQNWRAIYILIRSDGPPFKVIKAASSHWVPLHDAFYNTGLYVLGFVGGYLVLQLIQTFIVAHVAKWQHNIAMRADAGKHETLITLADHPELKALRQERDALREEIKKAWRSIDPSGLSNDLYDVYYQADQLPQPPCFARLASGHFKCGRLVEHPPNPDSLLFVFSWGGAGVVVAARPNAFIPWPGDFQTAHVIALAGIKTITYPEIQTKEQYTADGVRAVIVRGAGGHGDRWGHFSFLKLA